MSLKRRRRQAARRRQERETQKLSVSHEAGVRAANTFINDNNQSTQEETRMETQTETKNKLSTRESILDKLGGGKRLSRQDLFQAVMTDVGCTNDAVRNALARLVVAELVTHDGSFYSLRLPGTPSHGHEHQAEVSDRNF